MKCRVFSIKWLMTTVLVVSPVIADVPKVRSSDQLEMSFLDDSRLREYLAARENKRPSQYSEAYLDAYRKKTCNSYDNYMSYPTNEIRSFCKKYPAIKHRPFPGTASSSSTNTTNNSDSGSVSSNAHQACLSARDYEGCIRVKTNKRSNSSSSNCKPGKWCVAGSGLDMLGQPMIEGWYMKSMPSKQSVGYSRPGAQKVLVRGEMDRYIAKEMLVRYYQSPRAGTAPTTTTIGSASTNCYDTGYSISCTTTPATTITSPGMSARPGGVRQISFVTVVDCKDLTFARHNNGNISGKWASVSGTQWDQFANKYCSDVKKLEPSDFRKYAE